MANHSCYGDNTTSSGALIMNKVEAKVVLWIFERNLARDSLGKIALELQEQNIPFPFVKLIWNREAISNNLSNEKCFGSVLLQKTLSVCGTQFKNEGELERLLLRKHNEPTLSTQEFDKVQQIKNTGHVAAVKKAIELNLI